MALRQMSLFGIKTEKRHLSIEILEHLMNYSLTNFITIRNVLRQISRTLSADFIHAPFSGFALVIVFRTGFISVTVQIFIWTYLQYKIIGKEALILITGIQLVKFDI